MTSSLESLTNDSEVQGKTGAEIRKLLMKRLDINMVNDVTAEDVSISRTREGISVTVEYEARRSLFGNLSLLVDYNKSVIITR